MEGFQKKCGQRKIANLNKMGRRGNLWDDFSTNSNLWDVLLQNSNGFYLLHFKVSVHLIKSWDKLILNSFHIHKSHSEIKGK